MRKVSKHITREARQLFQLCQVNQLLDDGRVRQVVQSILDTHRREGQAVLWHFRRLVKLYRDRHTAEVESAIPLPREFQTTVQNRLEGLYGPGITTLFAQQPALIGGMRIKIGSDVYDGTVKAGLDALEHRF